MHPAQLYQPAEHNTFQSLVSRHKSKR